MFTTFDIQVISTSEFGLEELKKSPDIRNIHFLLQQGYKVFVDNSGKYHGHTNLYGDRSFSLSQNICNVVYAR